jgi:glycosyltransferase involved in cell wall biosynthesis
MVPVEAMASGRPVVAFGKGGAVETVADGSTGVFFHEQTVEAISSAVQRMATIDTVPQEIAEHARRFGREQFFQKMRTHLDGLISRKQSRDTAHRF